MSFICYKITHDSGFAPNPHFDVITLATCKPSIRRTKVKGDWIAGFSTKALVDNTKWKTGKSIKRDGLIYIMRVGERLTLDEYYRDRRFASKKPVFNHKDDAIRAGDNIYFKKGDIYFQHRNNSHDYLDENDSSGRPSIDHDAAGKHVLIADMSASFYFGDNCLVPKNGWDGSGFTMSSGRTFCRETVHLDALLKFIMEAGFQPGIHGNPCLRPPMCDESKVTCSSSCSGLG
jgi:hypothetical protein